MQHRAPDRRWPLVITEGRRKILAWHGAIRAMGLHPRSLVTAGHFCAYPEDLERIGFRITAAGLDEFARLPRGEFPRRLLRELLRHPAGAPILFATDADQEGDVIAFDVAQMIRRHAPALLSCTFRARPASMHAGDLQTAVERAVAESRRPGGAARRHALMERHAAPGRARDVLDRQLGAAHSRAAGQPCGRVKAAALGAVRMWRERPEALRRIPETGELRLRAAAADGGRPFAARVPLHGRVPEGLVRLAARFRGGDVPGAIHQPAPLSAAVAPRDGTAPLPNTGDALIEACRRDPEINVMAAMNGLNAAHMAGLISYPRTAARHVTEETARRMAAFALECGVPGLPGSVHECAAPVAADGAHEALHLAPGADADYLTKCFGAVPRSPASARRPRTPRPDEKGASATPSRTKAKAAHGRRGALRRDSLGRFAPTQPDMPPADPAAPRARRDSGRAKRVLDFPGLEAAGPDGCGDAAPSASRPAGGNGRRHRDCRDLAKGPRHSASPARAKRGPDSPRPGAPEPGSRSVAAHSGNRQAGGGWRLLDILDWPRDRHCGPVPARIRRSPAFSSPAGRRPALVACAAAAGTLAGTAGGVMAQGSAAALCGLVLGPAILVLLATAMERDFAAWRIERKRFGNVSAYVAMRWLRRGPHGRRCLAPRKAAEAGDRQ